MFMAYKVTFFFKKKKKILTHMHMKFLLSCVHAVNWKAGEGKRETGHMICTADELTKYKVTVAGR